MKTHAQAVVIGGGVIGCSILYHLTKLGWTDVVLLERNELTSGSMACRCEYPRAARQCQYQPAATLHDEPL